MIPQVNYYGDNNTMNGAVLLSGGVDSSVAAAFMREQGHQLTAFYLKIWLEDELSFLGSCPWQEDLYFVQGVCKQLSLPLEVVSLQREYWDLVVSYTISEIKAGKTPNPDILCNQKIKFGAFYETIDSSFDRVITGHYAQTEVRDGITYLKRSPDLIKDQSYFLAYMTQKQLQRACFPIGHLQKQDVRVFAQRFHLPTQHRKDSQGICFLGQLKFDDFIRYHLGEKPGSLVEIESGKKVGEHRGFWFYTLGQRHGIGLSGGPWYVVFKNIDDNTVFISRSYYSPDKERTSCVISRCNWIFSAPKEGNYQVKIRHGAHMHECHVAPLGVDKYQITLATSDQGLAPGQFAVLYEGEYCLGGGIIE